MNLKDIDGLKLRLETELNQINDSINLENFKLKYLARKGEIRDLFNALKNLGVEEKRVFGPRLNELKKDIESLFFQKKAKFDQKGGDSFFDYTQPGNKKEVGSLHPTTLILRHMLKVFKAFGFNIIEANEIESEYYNFDSLNIEKDHPARDMWDTFWFDKKYSLPLGSEIQKAKTENLLLRTHTSPVQMRYMEKNNPPFRIVVPGKVFRYEATDARHEFQLHQLEGLMVGDNISLCNFKSIITDMIREIVGDKNLKVRLRPSYFPFVSPGLEVDVECFKCHGKSKDGKCSLCSGSGFIEMMGAGMVHPNLYKFAKWKKYDYQGFAFGLGVERFAMLKYQIPDVRLFNSGDLRFTKQF